MAEDYTNADRVDSTGDRLEAITDAFVVALRAREAVTVADVVRQHPELAEELLELLPAVAAVEELAARQLAFSERQLAAPLVGRLGDFRIVREIGRGGMGIVYAAVQESLGRTVALKVLPQSTFLSPAQVERFRQEARTASRLQHANIVPIHAVGSEAGVHFFAMPMVDGVGLDRVLFRLQAEGEVAAHAHPPLPASEEPLLAAALAYLQPRSSGRDGYHQHLAAIGAQIAEALDHAHRAGVLHRDVKPANLLLEANGKAWITDFGVAKSLDQPSNTRVGELLGTLHYAAPESFDGEADARSDVYGLGLTLCELAAGAPAWSASGSMAMVEQIRRGIDRACWRRLRSAPRDFVTVIAKATAVEPDLRYATAAQFAVDLRRFCAGHPVLARGVSTTGRVMAWCRRNRLAAAAVAASLVAVVSAAAIGWGAFWTTQQALAGERRANGEAQLHMREAKVHMESALAEKAKAEANLELSLGSYDQLFDAIAIGHGDAVDAELADVPTTLPLSRKDLDLLQRVLAFYEQFAAANAEHEGLRQHAVRAFRRAGDIHRWMGESARAMAAFERALDFHGRVPTAVRDEGWHVERAVLYRSLGAVRAQGGGPTALSDFWRARDVLQGWLGGHSSRRCRHELARVHNAIGVAVVRTAATVGGTRSWGPPTAFFEQAMAADSHQRAVAIAASLVEEEAADRAALLLLARSHRLSAQARLRQQRADEGMAEVRQSLHLLAELTQRFPDEPGCRFELAEAHSLVAVAATDAAERAHNSAAAVGYAAELLRENAAMPEYEDLAARVDHRVGESALRDGDCERAIASFERAAAARAELWRRLPQVGHHATELMATAQAHAAGLRRCGRTADARRVLEQAADVAESAAAVLAPPFGIFAGEAIDRDLARLLRDSGDTAAAAIVEQRSRDRHRGMFGGRPRFGRPR